LTRINRGGAGAVRFTAMNEQRPLHRTTEGAGSALDAKVAFLSCPQSYRPVPAEVIRRETHMSWVFLAGERVYKLKKPVRFPYLDFSTIGRRERACQAELRLNRRLAPDVYLGVAPLTQTRDGLELGGEGRAVDWLVCMRRLDEGLMLERLIEERRLRTAQLDRLVSVLARFYRGAAPVFLSPAVHLADLRRELADNRRVLLDCRFSLPAGLIRRIDRTQRRFLEHSSSLIAARLRHRRIVDGHGDLRPEHIFIDDKVRIIDCLEFNPRLRIVDPFDEIAYLSLECERLGAPWVGAYHRASL
jgi:uncharacterized protein